MSVTAIITAHKEISQVKDILLNLSKQTKPIDEIILLVSCIDPKLLHPLQKDHKFQFHIEKDYNDAGHQKRQKGLSLATMDKVFFVNSDDEYDPTFIEKMDLDTDLTYCNFHSHLLHGECNSSLNYGRITSGSFMVRRELAQKVGWNHSVYHADWLFIEDLLKENPSSIKIPEVLYWHR